MLAYLQAAAPVLRLNSRTMKPTIDLFVGKLGFEIDTVLREPPKFAMLKRDSQIIMLECKPVIPWKQSGWAAYFWTKDVENLRQEFIENDLEGVTEVVEKFYGCLEFKVPLPDKRAIVFGQVISSS